MSTVADVWQVLLRPTATSSKVPEWYQMETTKNCPVKNLKIKIATRMDKPQNMKHCGCVHRHCFIGFIGYSVMRVSFFILYGDVHAIVLFASLDWNVLYCVQILLC